MSGTHIALAIAKKRARELEAELETLREDIEDWRKMAKEYATMWRILENLNLKATILTYMREDTDISEAIDEVTA
tara:strand:+ start:371 stop:595 length:225 start_codon:yes stop_codon:yes gene_type:complete